MRELVKRVSIPITFSREFESLLLNLPTQHTSLTHDIEATARRGTELLSELEYIQDLVHVKELSHLIEQTNYYSQMSSSYFEKWHIAVAEDLLDEIDLIILTHGDDLLLHGLNDVSHGSVLILLALTGSYHSDFRTQPSHQQPILSS